MPPLLRHTLQHIQKNFRVGLLTTVIIAFSFFLFDIVLFSNHLAKGFLENLQSSLSFTTYLKETIDPFSLRRLMEDVEKLKEVSPPVIYTSPEEARKKLRDAGIITEDSQLSLRTLPGSLTITPRGPDGREKIEDYLKKSAYGVFLKFPKEKQQTIETKTYERVKLQMKRLQELLTKMIFLLLAFSFMIILVAIFVSLRLGSLTRKGEIGIMKLVGASPTFLELPFLFEAITYSVLGLLFGTVLFLLAPSFGLLPSDEFILNQWKTFSFGNAFLLELLLAVLLGLSSGFLSLRKILSR